MSREERHSCFDSRVPGMIQALFAGSQSVICKVGAGYWTRGLRIYGKANPVCK
jgi:hypothetical protein